MNTVFNKGGKAVEYLTVSGTWYVCVSPSFFFSLPINIGRDRTGTTFSRGVAFKNKIK